MRFVLIGTLAGVLRGSPLLPVDATLELVPATDEANLDRLERTLDDLGAERQGVDTARLLPQLLGTVAVVPSPPGTSGYSDLRQDATSISVGADVQVLVASLADLARIAEASPTPQQRAQVVALRATLELAQADAGPLAASA